jgi:nucleoside-diphosphate-sugar epimerase
VQTIFLTGASGYIGGSVAQKLVSTGYHVRGLVRSAATAKALAARGIEPVLGSLDDADLLFKEARTADGVVNAASSDHAPSINALIAGLAGSAKPLLHTSGSSVIGDDARGGRSSETVFDEDTPLVVNPLKQARRNIDLMVLAAAQKEVRSVVICPSLIYGTGRGLHTESYQLPFLALNALKHGAVQVVGAGLNIWSNVHIDDVTDLFVLALVNAPPGAFYFAENGQASFAELGSALAVRFGLGSIESLDPDTAAHRWGEAMAYFSLGSNSRVQAKRARQELGWAPQHSSAGDWILGQMPAPASA